MGRALQIAKDTAKGVVKDVWDTATGGAAGRSARQGVRIVGRSLYRSGKSAVKSVKEKAKSVGNKVVNSLQKSYGEELASGATQREAERPLKMFKKLAPLSKPLLRAYPKYKGISKKKP